MPSRRHYCTYFDIRYLSRGLALYESLRKHAPSFILHVLCFDEMAYEYLAAANLEGIHPIRLGELEKWDPALPAVKSTRSLVEYYFTCAPELVLYVMDCVTDIQDVTYLDADLYFYSDPAPIYDAMESGSVGIIGHRFRADQAHLEKFGVYNVGFVFFRNDQEGRRCVAWWRDRCLEWCYDRFEDGKFADQKYLDQWPALFKGVVVIELKGAGVAPWNQARYAFSANGGRVNVDDQPLIFYHFHGVRLAFSVLSTHDLGVYGGHMTAALMLKIYVPYLRTLWRLQRRVRVAAQTDVRYARPDDVRQLARSMIHERVIILAGPIVLEMRIRAILGPVAWLYRVLRKARRLVLRIPSALRGHT